MKYYIEGLAVAFLLAGCGGTNSGPPLQKASTPAQTVTLDASHVSVTLTLQNGATVTISLAKGVPPPIFPIAVSAEADASKPAIVTLTSTGPVTIASAPVVTMHVATALSHRIIAESCRDTCKYLNEQIVIPSSLGNYTYQDSASVTLGGSHTFSVTFALVPNYQLVDLSAGTPFSGISPVALNDSDTIVASGNVFGSQTGLVYSGGTWTTIPPPPGLSSTKPFAISNTGVIAGSSGDRAFRYSAGVSTALGQLPPVPHEISQSNVATAISPDGQHIAGYTVVGTHDVSFADFTTATDFTAPGGPAPSACLNGRSVQANHGNDSAAYGVNSAGTVAGVVAPVNTLAEEIEIYACPVQQALGDGTTRGEALGINEAGDIVGYLWPSFVQRIPFLYSGGAVNALPIPAPYTDGVATELNNSDVIIGNVRQLGSTQSHLVVWRDGIAMFLNDLLPSNCVGWILDTATGINNRGDIIGTATKAGVGHAYMLQAVP